MKSLISFWFFSQILKDSFKLCLLQVNILPADLKYGAYLGCMLFSEYKIWQNYRITALNYGEETQVLYSYYVTILKKKIPNLLFSLRSTELKSLALLNSFKQALFPVLNLNKGDDQINFCKHIFVLVLNTLFTSVSSFALSFWCCTNASLSK